ncbi:FliM/FliN family flagellar motor switch protein [Zavarzinella formosa]|uniref:FliM/FliN family flagellar motor switch protein n=1 Tax=Zavarzinella formosa TaxID=360055 RepID=UPI00030CE172|nr:FliM/FliN family flagellar motor switch protein [Zavarzinella formosa]
MAPRIWSKILPFKIDLYVERVNAMSAVKALDNLSEGLVAFRLKLDQFPEIEPLLMLPRPLLLALINGSLGVVSETLPEDRELSTVENSICDFLINQLILKILGDSWPASIHPKFTISVRGEPKGVSRLPPNDLVVVSVLQLNGPFGSQPITLVMPRSAPLTELVRPSVDPVPVRPVAKELLEALVCEMPVDLAVLLGSTDLTMLQVATLRAGDVVVLGQKVNEPLRAKVAGKDKFAVWPGAVGRRQAVQVDTMLEQ